MLQEEQPLESRISQLIQTLSSRGFMFPDSTDTRALINDQPEGRNHSAAHEGVQRKTCPLSSRVCPLSLELVILA